MINHERIAVFLIELILCAEEKDIKNFLSNCFNNSVITVPDNDNIDYTALLVNYLFEHIFAAMELKLPIGAPLYFQNNKFKNEIYIQKYINSSIKQPNYTSLYLHLYALCECYYSYYFYDFNPDEKTTIQEIYKKQYNSDIKFKLLSWKDKRKLFNLLINSYSENKFYYYFYNNVLIKFEIIQKIQKKKEKYSYKITKYELKDNDKSTFIVDNNNNFSKSLRKILIRNNYNESCHNLNHENIKTMLESHCFVNMKKTHNKIIKILSEHNSTACKWCNHMLINNNNKSKVCQNCKKMLENLNKLSNFIDDMEQNANIYNIKAIKFKKYLDNISPKSSAVQQKNIRKKYLTNLINNLYLEVNNILSNRNNNQNVFYYIKLKKIIEETKDSISNSFRD